MNERRLELEGEIERMKQRLSYNIKRYRKLSRVSQQALADDGFGRLSQCSVGRFTERVIKCKSAIYFCWNIA